MQSSRTAQMPFSIVAVLILVLSTTSIALVYGLDVRMEDARIPEKTLEELKRAMDDSAQNVERIAYSVAMETVASTRDLNESGARERYSIALNASLNKGYPSEVGQIRVTVCHNLTLRFLRASLQESYATLGGDISSWDGASVPAYFIITGNYSLVASCPEGRLTRTLDVEQDVYVPLPLLLERMDRLSGVAAPRGDLESVVRYELSTLAQDRVLRGYGMAAKTGGMSTGAIITSDDVVRAINLALVLEELRYVQNAGDGQLSCFSELEPLISDLSGPVDPADLFLRSYDEGGIDLASLVAQCINARADAIVLRWLDYFGLIHLINGVEDLAEKMSWGLLDTVDFLSGGDTAQTNIVGYVSDSLAEAGIREYDYRWFCYGGPNALVTLPPYKICFFDDQGNKVFRVFQGTYSIDFPSVDLFSSLAWGDFYREYVSSTHILAEQMKGYLESIASCVASYCSLPKIYPVLDPVDDRSPLEEIEGQLKKAFEDRPLWLKPALDKANEIREVRDGLAQSVMDFLDSHWQELLEMNRSVYQGALELSWTLAWQFNGTPGFSAARINDAQRIIFAELLGGYWGAKEAFQGAFTSVANIVLDRIDRGLSQKNSSLDPAVNLLAFGLSCLPGIETLTSRAMLDTVDELKAIHLSQGGEVRVPLSSDGLTLKLSNGQTRSEEISVNASSLSVAGDGTGGSIDVTVQEPWEYDRSSIAYPNRHITDLLNMTTTPYQTQWRVEYEGSIQITLRAAVGPSNEGHELPCTRTISLQGSFNIVTMSGWALKGVSYAPTATLAQDIADFLKKAWDFITSAVQAVGGMVCKAFALFAQLVTDLLSYATKTLEVLGQILTEGVEALKNLATGLMSEVIGALADLGQATMNGTRVDLNVLGQGLMLFIGPSDSALAGTEDRMRMELALSCPGATVISSIRVLRLPDGQHTIAGSATLGGDDWSVDINLDPLTKVYQHQVEVRGFIGDRVIEMVAPEIERVQKVSLALHDVPGWGVVLDQIPSPVPGTKFHLDGGLEMSFNILDRRNVLINEVELNPAGKDASREWVELYNPTDQAMDLSGWSLATSRGQVHKEVLKATIPAHGYYVHVFDGQALDNGEVKGFPLQESVALLDGGGMRVNSAPWLKDLDDDGQTWQRSYDGSFRWELREESKEESNGFVLLQEQSTDAMLSVIQQCFEQALQEVMTAQPDTETLRELIQVALKDIADRMADAIGQTVASVRLYIELGLQDASGAIGGGVNVAIKFDGKAVSACIRWVMDAVGEVLRDPLNPVAAGLRAPVPMTAVAEHVFLQLGAYVSVSAPKFMAVDGIKIRAVAVVEANLEALGLLIGDGGQEVDFGLLIAGLPGTSIKSGYGVSARDTVDLWLLRGSIRPA